MSQDTTPIDRATTQTKRALLIAVDSYPKSDAIGDLKGAINDALLIRDVLVDKYLVPEENITLLTSPAPEGRPDDWATRERILRGLDDLIDASGEDDMVVVYFAGHGSEVRDRDLDEGTGFDSTIVPADAVRPTSRNVHMDIGFHDITDDEIHVKLLRLGKKTDNITLIFDSCHSGTMHRGPADPEMVARSAPSDDRPVDQLPPDPLSEEDRALLAESQSQRTDSGWKSPGGKYVLISGCRDTEKSYETAVKDSRGGGVRKHGALTYFLAQALREAKPGDTYQDIYERVAPRVFGNNPNQNPQIHGTTTREIFGAREIEPVSFFRVDDVQGTKVTIRAGAAHGLTAGSIWTLVEPGTRAVTDQTRVCEVRITEVHDAASFADVVTDSVREDVVPKAGLWAVEKEHDFGDQRMKIRLVGTAETDPESWAALEAALAPEGPWVRSLQRVEGSESAVKLVLVPQRDRVPEGDLVPQLGPTAVPMLAAVSEVGELMLSPKKASPEAVEKIIEGLDGWANYRYKLAIDNPGSTLASVVGIDLKTKVEGPDGVTWESVRSKEGGLPVLQAGKDEFRIHLTNRGPDDVFVGLLDFKINGGVDLIRETMLRGGTPEQPFEHVIKGSGPVEWEGGFPFDPDPFVDSPTEAVEVLKLFITLGEASFAPLTQGAATRGGGAGEDNPLQALLDNPNSGTRGFNVIPPDGWGTVSFPVLLRAPDKLDVQDGETVKLGGEAGTKITASGVSGRINIGKRVEFDGAHSRPQFPDDSPAARLQTLLAEQGIRPAQSFSVGDTSTAVGTRSAGGAPSLTVEVPAPEENWGELAMSTDDAGIVRWHFPVEASGSRAAGGAGTRKEYRIQPPVVDEAPPVGTRGLIGATLGKLFVDRIAFPLLDPLVGMALDLWESKVRPNQVRWLAPTDIENQKARLVQNDDWKRIGEDRALLFLHGPFSRAHKSFRDLTPEYMGELATIYGDRIFAFDHMTLAEDPLQNVQWFLNQLPPETKLHLDVVAHSRGGLVARALAERGNEFAMEGREVEVGRVVLAGSPNAGTPLANTAHVETMLNVFTNLLSVFDPVEVAGPIFQLAQKLATGAVKELPGLQAMSAGGAFLTEQPALSGRTQYYGIASDISSAGSDKFVRRLFNRVVRNVLGDNPNDLVVSATSVWGGADEFVTERKILTNGDARSHLKYFEVPSVQRQMKEWLIRDSAPIVVQPAATVQPAPESSIEAVPAEVDVPMSVSEETEPVAGMAVPGSEGIQPVVEQVPATAVVSEPVIQDARRVVERAATPTERMEAAVESSEPQSAPPAPSTEPSPEPSTAPSTEPSPEPSVRQHSRTEEAATSPPESREGDLVPPPLPGGLRGAPPALPWKRSKGPPSLPWEH